MCHSDQPEHIEERKRGSVITNFRNKLSGTSSSEIKRSSRANSMPIGNGKGNSAFEKLNSNELKLIADELDSPERLSKLRTVDIDNFEFDLKALVDESEASLASVSGDVDVRLKENKKRIDKMEKFLAKILTDCFLNKTVYELSAPSNKINYEELFGKLVIKKRGELILNYLMTEMPGSNIFTNKKSNDWIRYFLTGEILTNRAVSFNEFTRVKKTINSNRYHFVTSSFETLILKHVFRFRNI